jgi:hypothetical protein
MYQSVSTYIRCSAEWLTNEVGGMWKEAIVPYFKDSSQNLSRDCEENPQMLRIGNKDTVRNSHEY